MDSVLLQGILLMAGVGCFWTLWGFALGMAPRKGVSIPVMEFAMSIANLLAFGVISALQGMPSLPFETLLWVGLVLFAGGAINYFQHDFMSRAMLKGPNGIIWSLVQSGFVFPFLYGVIFYSQRLTCTNGLGVVFIVVALSLFGLAKDRNSKGAWKTAALVALGCTGGVQILTNTPSYYPEVVSGFSSAWRSLVFNVGVCTGSLLRVMTSRELQFKRLFLENARCKFFWIFCIGLLLQGVVCSIYFSYPGMDKLAEAHVGSIAYPLALAASLISFEAYAIIALREKRNRMQVTALVLMLLGAAGLCF